ncbi:hypothetical protein [Deinococcus altitudinis]|uniref:hypothetical protein n=1 Tax=Deinococcus altitudinis TaxID=468914 RepID=UPI0038927350
MSIEVVRPTLSDSVLQIFTGGPRRRAWTDFYIFWGDIVPLLTAVIFFLCVIVLNQKPTSLWNLIPGFLLTTWAVTSKMLKNIVDKDEKARKAVLEKTAAEAEASGILQGSTAVYTDWGKVALKHRFALEAVSIELQSYFPQATQVQVHDEAARKHLQALLELFGLLFSEAGPLVANLAMVKPRAKELWIVVLEPGRAKDRKPLPRLYPLETGQSRWGMSVCVERKKIVYTAEVPQDAEVTSAYLSVINLPVMTSDGRILAVVNIDSDRASAFGIHNQETTQQRLDQAEEFAAPILQSLAVLLLDRRLFSKHREVNL